MRSLKTNKVFVSAHNSRLTYSLNSINHAKAISMLESEGIRYTVVDGSWRGVCEKSFLLESTDIEQHDKNLSVALKMGLLFNQESVLEVHNDDTAVLHSGEVAHSIGAFQEISEEESLKLEGWTFVNGRYFTIK